MKTLIALAASIAVNAAILGALDWSAWQAQVPPAGEVSITQLPLDADLAAYASADSVGDRRVRVML
jgi:hypothetical protein